MRFAVSVGNSEAIGMFAHLARQRISRRVLCREYQSVSKGAANPCDLCDNLLTFHLLLFLSAVVSPTLANPAPSIDDNEVPTPRIRLSNVLVPFRKESRL
jgi:hypothetical protein